MQLYKAAELFETIRRDQLISTDYKLSLFDLQTASYQALQVGNTSCVGHGQHYKHGFLFRLLLLLTETIL